MNRLVNLIKKRLTDSWKEIVFTNYGKHSFEGKEIYKKILFIHQIFKELGIKKGDKIALLGKNTSEWAIIFLATIVYGVVIVPILPDFSKNDLEQITKHSEVKLFFTSKALFDKVPKDNNVIAIHDFQVIGTKNENIKKSVDNIKESFAEKAITGNEVEFVHSDENNMAVLSYTSGTLGFTKGVMISFKNLYSNVLYGKDNFKINPGENILSFLPLAHTYGCMYEFLCPFCIGIHIHFINQTLAMDSLIKAFQQIRPKIILMVPLILEKIYKKRILPKIKSQKIQFLLKIPGIKSLIYNKIKYSLIHTFGGNFFEIIIGGAALNAEVETFFRKIKFPFTVGYGMTECAPLISYSHHYDFKPFSSGRIIDRMEVKIDSENPYIIPGEIMVKGSNVMLGYFKNQEETKRVIDDNGWLRTGDLGVVDKDDVIYIKGRSKNMLLGPSGQNIYPEEIEAKISNLYFVQECLVVDDKNHKLVAIVYPEPETCKIEDVDFKEVENILNSKKNHFNKQFPSYMHVSRFVVINKEFEKTPKKSIKRYLYMNRFKQEHS